MVGVIGAGSFGTTIAKLLSENSDVLIFSRKKETLHKINEERFHYNTEIPENITATSDLEYIANNCQLIFPIVPSTSFRVMMQSLSPFLKPSHFLIHGTKGFDLTDIKEDALEDSNISRQNVHTMSEVISQESVVKRIGCLSGPNLSTEILAGQPTATLLASSFDEVIALGRKQLSSKYFQVFGSNDLIGAELTGVLKNIIAIGAGVLHGKGLGKNIWGVLITNGLAEMIRLGKAMGANEEAFWGVAGVGDLVATASSPNSRNFNFGVELSKNKTYEEVKSIQVELAEGVRTLKIAKQLAKELNVKVPLFEMLYKIVFENYDIEEGLEWLLDYRLGTFNS